MRLENCIKYISLTSKSKELGEKDNVLVIHAKQRVSKKTVESDFSFIFDEEVKALRVKNTGKDAIFYLKLLGVTPPLLKKFELNHVVCYSLGFNRIIISLFS